MLIAWKDEVDPDDYQAAENYLTLRLGPRRAALAREELERTEITTGRVNDILRATGREPLSPEDPGVQRTLRDISNGKELGPILVITFDDEADIADGYHRVSAAYHHGKDGPFGDIPMVLARVRHSNRAHG